MVGWLLIFYVRRVTRLPKEMIYLERVEREREREREGGGAERERERERERGRERERAIWG